jgi:hypothetical protein
MTTIEERRLNFINEKLGYFIEDPSRRAYNQKTESCMYWDKSTGNKCLIGMEIPKEKYNKAYEGKSLTFENSLRKNSVFDLLPVEVQELGVYFLKRCQCLHDEESYWDEDGLSDRGESKLASIKAKYCNVN